MDSDSDQEDPDPATFCQGVSKTSTPTKRTSGLQNKNGKYRMTLFLSQIYVLRNDIKH